MKEERKGLDVRPQQKEDVKRRQSWIARWNEVLAIGEQDEQAFRAATVDTVAEYVGIQLPTDTHDSVISTEQRYRRIEHAIGAAQSSFNDFASHLLVDDIRQGIGDTNELARISDPGVLIDVMLHGQSKRARFEARRALWLGAHFWKYEEEVGRIEDLQNALRGLEMYIDATLGLSSTATTRPMYYHLDIENGKPQVSGVRIPGVDNTSIDRINGENLVYIAVRQMPDPKRPGEYITVAIDARPKSRLSATLKCLRKGERFSDLRDILGVSVTVFQRHGDELHSIVELLDGVFAFDPDDRHVHPLREVVGKKNDENGASSVDFQMEKGVTTWNMDKLREQRKHVDVVGQRLFPSSRATQLLDKSIERLKHKHFPVEIQAGTLEDMIALRFAEADVNHGVYEAKRTIKVMEGHDLTSLELLYPFEIYGIDWTAPIITRALRAKQLATLGVTAKILKQLEEMGPR